MPDRDRFRDRERGRPEDEPERMHQRDDPGRNFEEEVSESDINMDPDAGFDFDRTPTDEHEARHSDR